MTIETITENQNPGARRRLPIGDYLSAAIDTRIREYVDSSSDRDYITRTYETVGWKDRLSMTRVGLVDRLEEAKIAQEFVRAEQLRYQLAAVRSLEIAGHIAEMPESVVYLPMLEVTGLTVGRLVLSHAEMLSQSTGQLAGLVDARSHEQVTVSLGDERDLMAQTMFSPDDITLSGIRLWTYERANGLPEQALPRARVNGMRVDSEQLNLAVTA